MGFDEYCARLFGCEEAWRMRTPLPVDGVYGIVAGNRRIAHGIRALAAPHWTVNCKKRKTKSASPGSTSWPVQGWVLIPNEAAVVEAVPECLISS